MYSTRRRILSSTGEVSSVAVRGSTVAPLGNINVVMQRGTRSISNAGRTSVVIWCNADTLPPVQSNSVVTSPIGDHEPPAFDAMIIIELKIRRVLRSGIRRRAMAIITITVAKLPSNTDIKNVTKHNTHNNLRCTLVVIALEIMLKPPCVSMMSIIAIEPSTKKSVVATSPKPSTSLNSTNSKASWCVGISRSAGKASKN